MIYRDVKTSLQRKGFQLVKGSNHIRFIYYDTQGKRGRPSTQISHGRSNSDQVDRNMRAVIAKQMHLNTKQFEDFVECSVTVEQYEQIIETKFVDGQDSADI